MNFNEAFTVLIGHEGRYTDDPKDRGNWTSGKIGIGICKGTKYGISAMTYPKVDIKNLTLENAKEIYKRDFWDTIKLDQLPEYTHLDLFDMSVNCGSFVTIKTLQKTIGTKPDGIIGPDTISKVFKCENFRLKFNSNRLLYYISLHNFDKYGKGWVRRVAINLTL